MNRPWAKWIELLAGGLVGVAGVLGLAYALFGPLYAYESGTQVIDGEGSKGTVVTEAGRSSLLEQGLEPLTWAFLVVILMCALVVAVGACVHSLRGGWSWLTLVWVSAGALTFGVILSGFSIGFLLTPAALLGLLAGVMGLLRVEPPR